MWMKDFLAMKKIKERELIETFSRPVLALEFVTPDQSKVYQVLPELKCYRVADSDKYQTDQWPQAWTDFDPYTIGTLKHINPSFDIEVGLSRETDTALTEIRDGDDATVQVTALSSYASTEAFPIFCKYEELSLHGQTYEVITVEPCGAPAMIKSGALIKLKLIFRVEGATSAFFQT